MKYYIKILLLITSTISGCQKYLDVKSDKSLVVPTTAADLRALLNNTERMNSWYPSVQEGATDNIFVQPTNWQNLSSLTAKNIYIWNDDAFNDSETNEWSMMYAIVYNSNVILEQLEKIDPIPDERNQIRGEALFFRSFAFYNISQLWSKPYNKSTAKSDLGIPLRLTSDINEKIFRSSLEETYQKITDDLKMAATLLAEKSTYKTTPTSTAAYGLLARVYLSMEDYESALKYADSYLHNTKELLDYKTLTMGSATSFPIPRFNIEVVFHATNFGRPIMNVTNGRINNDLYNTYGTNDLRKTAFFRDRVGTYSFRGSYDGSASWFSGISTNEIYLIKAESEIRIGSPQIAVETINQLIKMRWDTSFVPFVSTNNEVILEYILTERRKELIWRGLRWSDLRRLNKDNRFTKTITREINGEVYTLEPNSLKYVLPIPLSVILNTGMPQNDR
ncbi:RagB/SusD family nutrient uptake outer membrane protein [Polluticaenibacter yanchengensis]|uniref:RagB/SusD family nutrient uptake outer membrane protein n=1 Tax=Polluticaenibacter yanchengensis TaxID=3014562 RepID=A0ABT4UMU8_9BACT|nr:RagB/SusD family nutrient uptake outer membrane protein [Chitinophagaceae bacterium LY-5]